MEPKRKIDRDEWPAIIARHATGESLASIARAYGYTPPAIRYVVRQGRKPEARGEDDQAHAASAPIGREEEAGRLHANSVSLLPPTRPIGFSATRADVGSRKEGFDVSLREAMTLEVSSLLVAFDAVVARPSAEAVDQLRSATDRLLRAAARIRIELERVPASGAGHGRMRNKVW